MSAFSSLIGVLAGGLTFLPLSASGEPAPPAKVYTVMPLGDSITEGAGGFGNYRFPLWEKLHAAGYFVEFVGSRSRNARIGPLKHEGYGGHRADYFAKNIETLYKQNPADIVLLHAGHNYTVEEQPIPTILASTETIITTVRRLNPLSKVLVAQVIASGKLPKYSYIPELNIELAKLVERLDPRQENVILVNQAEGFDFRTDCVGDMVHPNLAGAEKMAEKWFEAMTRILPSPGLLLEPTIMPYKSGKGYSLSLHVFRPKDASADLRPAVVYFFGGGWSLGTPLQFYAECRELAANGIVAISADYRIPAVTKSTPYESLADANSAVRWVRQHAAELGVDPNRIVAAGSSAGGHLAAATAICEGFDEPGEPLAVSAKPNALILLAPVINNGPDGFGHDRVKDRYEAFSPFHALHKQPPPMTIFLGEHDQNTPVAIAKDFQQRVAALGGRCDLHLFPGVQHGLFSYREPPSKLCLEIRADSLKFLRSIGYAR